MTSVPSRLPPLSGSERPAGLRALLALFAAVLLSCSMPAGSRTIIPGKKHTLPDSSAQRQQIRKDDLRVQDTLPRRMQKSEHTVVLLLPLHLDSVSATDSAGIVPSASLPGLGFYEGASVALDSLEKKGFRMRVYVADSESDSAALARILPEKVLRDADAVVDLAPNKVPTAVKLLAQKQKVHLVFPLYSDTLPAMPNLSYAALSPPLPAHCSRLTGFLASSFPESNFLTVGPVTPGQQEQYFLQCFRDSLPGKIKISVREVKQDHPAAAGLTNYLSKDRINVVFVPSMNETYVYFLLGQLKQLLDDYKIVVAGLPGWKQFESIDIEYLSRLQVCMPSGWWIDYADSSTIHFRNKYMEKYKSDPDFYAFAGYDALMMLGMAFSSSTYKNEHILSGLAWNGLFSDYDIRPVKRGNKIARYENTKACILMFRDNKLVKISGQ